MMRLVEVPVSVQVPPRIEAKESGMRRREALSPVVRARESYEAYVPGLWTPGVQPQENTYTPAHTKLYKQEDALQDPAREGNPARLAAERAAADAGDRCPEFRARRIEVSDHGAIVFDFVKVRCLSDEPDCTVFACSRTGYLSFFMFKLPSAA